MKQVLRHATRSLLLGMCAASIAFGQYAPLIPRSGQWVGDLYAMPSATGATVLLDERNAVRKSHQSPVPELKGLEHFGKAERSSAPYHVEGAWYVTTRKTLEPPGPREMVTLRRLGQAGWETVGTYEGPWSAPTVYPCRNDRFLFVGARAPSEAPEKDWSPFQLFRLTEKGRFEFVSFIPLEGVEGQGPGFELDLLWGPKVLLDDHLAVTAPQHGHVFLLDLESGRLRFSHRLFPEVQAKLPKLKRLLPIPTLLFAVPLKDGNLLLASRSEQALAARAQEMAQGDGLQRLQEGAGASQRAAAFRSTDQAVDDSLRGFPVVEWWLLDPIKRKLAKTSTPQGGRDLVDSYAELKAMQVRPYADNSVYMGPLKAESLSSQKHSPAKR